jgi:hypothetical protein
VHVVEQHREIGLAIVEHPPEFLEALRCHVPCMRILCSGRAKHRLSETGPCQAMVKNAG